LKDLLIKLGPQKLGMVIETFKGDIDDNIIATLDGSFLSLSTNLLKQVTPGSEIVL